MQQPTSASRQPQYELRFSPFANCAKGYAFPCDAAGEVDLDALSETGRDHYFFARTVVGADFCMPTVVPVADSRFGPRGN